MAPRLRVLIADPLRMWREVLESGLSRTYDLLPGAPTLEALERALQDGGADVVILELLWGAEGAATPRLAEWRRRYPGSRMLIVADIHTTTMAHALIEAGASGVLGKSANFWELGEAIEAVARGDTYLGRAHRSA